MPKLRNVPGVQGIEDALLLNRAGRVTEDHALAARIHQVSQSAFGLSSGESYFELPAWVCKVEWDDIPLDKREALLDASDAWEEHFDLHSGSPLAAWDAIGWDVRDARGEAMQCLEWFVRQMICVSKGLLGRSLEEVASDAWAASLSPAKRSVHSPVERAQNELFLALGAQNRKRPAGQPRIGQASHAPRSTPTVRPSLKGSRA